MKKFVVLMFLSLSCVVFTADAMKKEEALAKAQELSEIINNGKTPTPDYLDLNGANLTVADLHEINLSGASLIGTNFFMSNLSGAILSSVKGNHIGLANTNLSKADLSNAILPWANLSCADLSKANLSGADLSGANLGQATLYKTNLCEANLSNAQFAGANLCEADLRGADLSLANLAGTLLREARINRDTKFDGTILAGADLRGAMGLTTEQLAYAQAAGADCRFCVADDDDELSNAGGEFDAFSELRESIDSTTMSKDLEDSILAGTDTILEDDQDAAGSPKDGADEQ